MQRERKIYLPYMLSYLEQARFTGILSLMEGELERSIYINQGKPVHVRSPLLEETLGRLLLDLQRITEEQYNQLLEMMVQTGRQAGEILISIGALGPHEVFSALEEQTSIKLNNCFQMVDFGFGLEAKTISPQLLIAKIEVRDAVLSGIRTKYNLGRLLNEFPAHEETRIRCRVEQCELGPREQKLFRQIGDGIELAQLVSEQNDLSYVMGVVYALHAILCVEVSGINWPRPDDLELDGLDIPDMDTKPGYAALMQDDGPDLLADWDSEPPPTEEPMSTPIEKPPPSEPRKPQEPPPNPQPSEAFDAPPTQAFIHAGLVTPKLAQKILSMTSEDHFTLLGISRNAGEADIKQAYHRTLNAYQLDQIEQTYITDKERELAARLLDYVTIAYRELSEEDSRKAYVNYLRHQKKDSVREPPARILADLEAQKGKAAMGARRYEQARRHFQTAIRLNPNESDHHYNLGRLEYQVAMEKTPRLQNLPDTPIAHLEYALRQNPRHDRARIYLGYIYKRNGDPQKALNEFKLAADYNPNNRIALAEIRLVEQEINESKKT
ncbi:MAG: tetratricopeptide repeat protein [Deltaproteobacteria bacterium]|nr:tetratricopeptide repeat protein [Deltaproteobacteria bacterium]